MRSRRLWIGFKVTCGNCNKAGVKRFLGVSPGICQLLLSFHSVDSVGNQRVTHREEGVCACVSMQVYLCVDVCVWMCLSWSRRQRQHKPPHVLPLGGKVVVWQC